MQLWMAGHFIYGMALRKLFERVGFHVIDFSKSASLVNPKDIWLGYVLEKS
jgi:hypothetical protein